MTLIDIVSAAQEITDDDREVVAIVNRLLSAGRVRSTEPEARPN